MQSERYPFNCPEEAGRVMAKLFPMYLSHYSSDSFPLSSCKGQRTSRCVVGTPLERKWPFQYLPELLKAIHNCEGVTAPEKAPGLPSDWGFAGFMKAATHKVADEVPFIKGQEFEGPLFNILGNNIIIDSRPRIKGVQIFYLCHNHWSCMIRNHSSAFDPKQQENCNDYLLRSELLAVTSIFWCQMNEMVWLPEKDRYTAKPIYKEGFLTNPKATVVTFICGKVRIVRATCDPSEKYPMLTFTLRAIYNLGKENYDKEVAFDVLKWILSPPEPAKELAMGGKE
ncbi:hypothetical protein AJ80_09538 [Polytolypa hystricis UAMH7299]|uniref:Uncharacterized protein n=1 Tax=Polytolypa hystricis (strain UAMH7299) TaxID=1447883 RepID=A0A2B7WP98_POLH7|nr:hypothetical protein AJ80_09538 [Polytolypa hystricis UAMH7299]